MNDLYLPAEKESICTSEERLRLFYHWLRPRPLPPTKQLGRCADSPTTMVFYMASYMASYMAFDLLVNL